MKSMEGWETLDFNRLRVQSCAGSWRSFFDQYIVPLMEREIVEDIAPGLGLTSRINYLVVRAGKREEVERAILGNSAVAA